ncbi:hypothetical protein BPAE_0143g00300 [Botrytis paeoniae]|uniref:Uncharacterized protein n=1 Tax=Botrytis paeoniae TaxID=278948 RepID=A0A4Z1FJZ7_9HELO|nr:hypothetical protein BPAE_0143g00300 [Botrytis paeoniae]
MSTVPEIISVQPENMDESYPPNPDAKCFHSSPSPGHSFSPGRQRVLAVIVISECFLAPINILSGMMAPEGKAWRFEYAMASGVLYSYVLLLLNPSNIIKSSSSMDSDNLNLWAWAEH